MVSLKHDWINVFLPRRCWNDQHSWPYLGGKKNERFGRTWLWSCLLAALAGHLPRKWGGVFLKHWQWSDPPKNAAHWNPSMVGESTLNGLMFSPRFAMFLKSRRVASSIKVISSHFRSWFCWVVEDALNSKFVQLKIDWDHSWWWWFQIVLLNRFPVYIFCSRERGRNEIRCCGCA